jgi:L-malate glycosyltransferase
MPLGSLVPKVTVIQRILPHYREPLFVSLHRQLANVGIQFQLIYGQEYPGTVPRSDRLEHPWAIRLENRYFDTSLGRLVWQPCLRQLQDSDLIIIEQANSLLVNYWLMVRRKLSQYRLAFWGHGQNFQAPSIHSLSGDWKKWLVTQVDWWFAYTEASAQIVRESGFSPENITIVQNAIDTKQLQADISGVTDSDLASLRACLELPKEHIALYCGGMYAEKQLDFLLEASYAIRKRISDFSIIFIGSGPDQGKVELAAREHPWIHYVGQKIGRERAVYFKASQALLIPGAVGLAIVDSFVAETPLFTTTVFSHGPEIAYLRNGENGVMTVLSVNEYADSVAAFLESGEVQSRLRKGCAQSAQLYSISNMVSNFSTGIQSCLNKNLTS